MSEAPKRPHVVVIEGNFEERARKRDDAIDDDDDGLRIDKRELDAAYRKARAVTEPLLEIVYLGTALGAAITTAIGRAKRNAAKRRRIIGDTKR